MTNTCIMLYFVLLYMYMLYNEYTDIQHDNSISVTNLKGYKIILRITLYLVDVYMPID